MLCYVVGEPLHVEVLIVLHALDLELTSELRVLDPSAAEDNAVAVLNEYGTGERDLLAARGLHFPSRESGACEKYGHDPTF
ncbi:MAG: hypothetical protein ABFD46_08305 [Armatimonadota bacterium]